MRVNPHSSISYAHTLILIQGHFSCSFKLLLKILLSFIYLWLVHVDTCQKPSQYCNYPPIKIINSIKIVLSFLLKYN